MDKVENLEKGVLFSLSELLFTLSCCITQTLLSTKNLQVFTGKFLYIELDWELVIGQKDRRETVTPPGRT